MLINKAKRAEQNLKNLPFLPLQAEQVEFLFSPLEFKAQIIELIRQAKKRIYVTALYWQKDEAGQEILNEIYRVKQDHPELDVKILVDWHRGQRNLLGAEKSATNADWYCEQRQTYQLPDEPNMFFGVPINTREVFGVLHIKGFVFDDTVLYSGASINNVYLQQQDKYRYDRYQKIHNAALADSMVNFINDYLLDFSAVHPLDVANRPRTKEIRSAIKAYRKNLSAHAEYQLESAVGFSDVLTISPLFGLGASANELNQVIEDLFLQVKEKLVICTPYFNFPRTLRSKLARLLEQGKRVEIIVGVSVMLCLVPVFLIFVRRTLFKLWAATFEEGTAGYGVLRGFCVALVGLGGCLAAARLAVDVVQSGSGLSLVYVVPVIASYLLVKRYLTVGVAIPEKEDEEDPEAEPTAS